MAAGGHNRILGHNTREFPPNNQNVVFAGERSEQSSRRGAQSNTSPLPTLGTTMAPAATGGATKADVSLALSDSWLSEPDEELDESVLSLSLSAELLVLSAAARGRPFIGRWPLVTVPSAWVIWAATVRRSLCGVRRLRQSANCLRSSENKKC